MFSLTRPGCLEPLRRGFILSPPLCRLHSTIFNKKASAHHRDLLHLEQNHVRALLGFLLRPFAGRSHGLPVRDDGSLSVRDLLRHPQFSSMNIFQLEQCVLSDLKHRFELTYDPKRTEDPWWVRVKLWNEKNKVLYPIIATDSFNLPVVYTTTLAEWEDHIAAKGIFGGREGYIHLTLGLPATNLIPLPSSSSTLSSSPIVHIHVDPILAIKQSNIPFFLVGSGPQAVQSVRTIWTKGDENGIIPPKYFENVEVVRVQKRVLVGEWEENIGRSSEDQDEDDVSNKVKKSPYPIPDSHIDPATGQRRTFVRLPNQNVRGFVDIMPAVGGWRLPIAAHGLAQQQDEARELVFEGA